MNTTPVVDVYTNTENLEGEETGSIERFLRDGCGCDLASGSCSNTFTAEYINTYRSQCRELTRAGLDVALLGQLAAFVNSSSLSVHFAKHRHTSSRQQRTYTCSTGMAGRESAGTPSSSSTRYRRRGFGTSRSSLRENGLAPRRHSNTRRLPPNTISFTDTQRVVEFLHSYAEANAILLPGRIPGYTKR